MHELVQIHLVRRLLSLDTVTSPEGVVGRVPV